MFFTFVIFMLYTLENARKKYVLQRSSIKGKKIWDPLCLCTKSQHFGKYQQVWSFYWIEGRKTKACVVYFALQFGWSVTKLNPQIWPLNQTGKCSLFPPTGTSNEAWAPAAAALADLTADGAEQRSGCEVTLHSIPMRSRPLSDGTEQPLLSE